MACPYFYPVKRQGARNGIVPLGDSWTGECRASAPVTPDAALLSGPCNFGYARGKCPHFPDDGGPDAVRFCVARHQDGLVRLRYVLEKAWLPYEHGNLEYSIEGGAFFDPRPRELLARQARAYVESYLRRKNLS